MNHNFDVENAKKYGMLEAVLINNFEFWVAKNEANGDNYFGGKYWVYNSSRALAELLPYATPQQIKKALKHLREKNVLMAGEFNRTAYDRTLWYTFTDEYLSSVKKEIIDGSNLNNGEFDMNNGEFDMNNGESNTNNGEYETVPPIPDKNTNINTDKDTDKNKEKVSKDTSKKEDEFVDVYSRECFNLPQIRSLTDTRKKSIKTFLKTHTLREWEEVCKIANTSDFLCGKNDRGWRADFDFLINVNKATRVLEGKYSGKPREGQEEGTSNPFLKVLMEMEEENDTQGNNANTGTNEDDVSTILPDYTIE